MSIYHILSHLGRIQFIEHYNLIGTYVWPEDVKLSVHWEAAQYYLLVSF